MRVPRSRARRKAWDIRAPCRFSGLGTADRHSPRKPSGHQHRRPLYRRASYAPGRQSFLPIGPGLPISGADDDGWSRRAGHHRHARRARGRRRSTSPPPKGNRFSPKGFQPTARGKRSDDGTPGPRLMPGTASAGSRGSDQSIVLAMIAGAPWSSSRMEARGKTPRNQELSRTSSSGLVLPSVTSRRTRRSILSRRPPGRESAAIS